MSNGIPTNSVDAEFDRVSLDSQDHHTDLSVDYEPITLMQHCIEPVRLLL